MTNFRLIGLACSLLLCTTSALAQAPGNDDCSGPITISVGTTPFDLTLATDSTEPGITDTSICDSWFSSDNQIYRDLWFIFTPPSTGFYDIEALAQPGFFDFNSRLAIYDQASCPTNPADIVACDNVSGPVNQAAILGVTLSSSTTYFIRVGGSGTNFPVAPANLVITTVSGPPANDDCAGAIPASLGTTAFDSTLATDGTGTILDPLICHHTTGFPVSDEQIYQDLWYTFTPMVTDNYDLSIVNMGNTPFDSQIAVYNQSTCPDDPNLAIACDDNSGVGLGEAAALAVPLTGGQTYLVRLGSARIGTVEQPAGLNIAVSPPPPVNDDCIGATPVGLGLTSFDLDLATDGTGLALDPVVCDMGPYGDEQIHQDVWFSFTAPSTGLYNIGSVNNGNQAFDSRLAVYNQPTCPDNPANVIGCDDDSGIFTEAAVSLSLTANLTYLIRVGAYSDNVTLQPAALSIGFLPSPANDDCANATVITGFGTYALDNTGATTDGADMSGFCDLATFGTELVHKDVWYSYTPTVGGCTYISTLGLAGFDTSMAVYDSSSCPDDPSTIIACSSEEVQQPLVFPWEAGLDVDLVVGQTYLIRIGSYGNPGGFVNPGGAGQFVIAQGPTAINNDGGNQTGVQGCAPAPAFPEFCNGDGGNQLGCTDCPCGNNAPQGTIGGCLNSASTSLRLIPSGDPSVSLPSGDTTDLRFGATGAPPTAFCILNSGDAVAPGNPANPCFGMSSGAQALQFDGLRCAIVNTRRHGGRSADGNGDVGFTNSPWGGEGGPPVGIANAGGGFAAGQTRFFQLINRDDELTVCMRALNTSQAAEVTFTP